MEQKVILFDLDGTLTDSGEGIINCVVFALEHYGLPVPSKAELRSVVGPPLHDTLARYGVPKEKLDEAVTVFRSRYNPIGIYENVPYPGIREALEELKREGYKLCVATSKPEEFALRIMEHFGLAAYFHRICGAQREDRASAQKGSVVADALRRSGTDGPAVMVGDRRFDVVGAHENGLPAIGVLYGYGGREELENAGADYLAADLHELKQLLLQE